MRIETVDHPSDEVVQGLAELLLDAVDSGASVSFMPDLQRDQAEEWWRKKLEAATDRAVILIARDDEGIVGTVQLEPSWAPNQPHRADVIKLLVHRRARGNGVARALMQELERRAIEKRFTVLVLDTCKGTPAERLYASLGWVSIGAVPNYALYPDGSPCDAVFFYRQL